MTGTISGHYGVQCFIGAFLIENRVIFWSGGCTHFLLALVI